MSTDELQIEEIEVLDSIYDGDELFKKLNPTTYQYMVMHPTNEHKNFLLEVAWGKTYPDEPPEINLDAFYNKHITVNVKNGIRETILNQVGIF
jgi:ubiquitin-protein ligase